MTKSAGSYKLGEYIPVIEIPGEGKFELRPVYEWPDGSIRYTSSDYDRVEFYGYVLAAIND